MCSGDADSTIRVWAMRFNVEAQQYSGRNISRISLQQRRTGPDDVVLVWAVKLLR